MNTDSELIAFIEQRVIDLRKTFEHPNLEDKLDKLELLSIATKRVMEVVEGQLALTDKPYPARYIPPWRCMEKRASGDESVGI